MDCSVCIVLVVDSHTALSVAEINQSLVDDGLVDREKIGGSNYFWSFPAKKDRQTQLEHEKLLQDIERLRQQAADASVALADAKRGREEDDSHERATKLQRLQQLAQDKTLLQAELETLQENDPQALADLEKEFLLVQQAANRWTDNLFNAKDYLVKKRGMEKSMALKVLGITSAFDCK
jgi:hypothetical protein